MKTSNELKIPIFLFFVALLIFIRTVNYDFVWDDERIHLTVNKELMEGNVSSFWKNAYSGMYIPVTYTTWSLVKTLFYPNSDVSPGAFHLLNIIFHALNSVLIFLLLQVLFRNRSAALTGSLIFILHPMQVEAVAWISEFRGIYSMFFSLLALYLLFSFISVRTNLSVSSLLKAPVFWLATFLFLLGILAKPSVMVLPVLVILIAYVFFKESFKVILKTISLWVLLTIPVIIITNYLQPVTECNKNLHFTDKILIAGYSFAFYLKKLIIPYPLAASYGETPHEILHDNLLWLYVFFSLSVLIFILCKLRSKPVLFAITGMIFVSLLPVLGFISFKFQYQSNVADRYTYSAFLGVAMFFGYISLHYHKLKSLRFALPCVMSVYLILTIFQTGTWKNEFEVWDHTLHYFHNSAHVYYCRGVEYSKREKFREAISDYDHCLSLQPNYKNALFNRINAYEHLNYLDEALRDCDTYLKIDPYDGAVYYRKAILLQKEGKITEAQKYYKLAQQNHFDPNSL